MNLSLCLSILVAACSVQSFSPSLLSSRRSSFSFAQSTIFSTSTTTHLRLSDSNVDVLEKQSSNSSASQVSPIEDASSSLTTLVVQGDTPELLVQTEEEEKSDAEYQKGILTIGFICLLNASLAPVWHTVFASGNSPPPLFLNAVVSVVALIGLLAGGPFLDSSVESSSALAESNSEEKWSWNSFRGGMELGVWKGLGTTCHIYGMALTTANHGAFLLQLTTLIVPVIQGIQGEKIPRQIQLAVALALVGIVAFTQDPTGSSDIAIDAAQIQLGDTLVLGAAFFYSLYDIQTYYWGREVPRTELVTIKIGFQAVLSCIVCAIAARTEVMDYIASGPDLKVMIPVVLWSGLIVNALATFLQVGGMQSVGPTRAQTVFASQPLWASIMNYVFIGEIMGTQGFLGGGAFLGALFLAATADAPKPKLKGAEAS